MASGFEITSGADFDSLFWSGSRAGSIGFVHAGGGDLNTHYDRHQSGFLQLPQNTNYETAGEIDLRFYYRATTGEVAP